MKDGKGSPNVIIVHTHSSLSQISVADLSHGFGLASQVSVYKSRSALTTCIVHLYMYNVLILTCSMTIIHVYMYMYNIMCIHLDMYIHSAGIMDPACHSA